MNWDKLKIFYYVAREKNISSAANILRVTHSAVSKKISSLEVDLGATLLKRHVRGVELTPYGQELFFKVRDIYRNINVICSDISQDHDMMNGSLKIISDYGFVDTWLGKRIPQFIKNHPKMNFDLKSQNTPLDLTKDDYDVGISTQVIDSEYVEKKILMTWQRKLYASREYLSKMGEPKTINCLNHHRLISFGEDKTFPNENMDWHLRLGCEDSLRKPFYTVNSMRSIIDAAKQDLGIISFSEESELLKDANLVNVLPNIIGPRVTLYIVFYKEGLKKTFVNQFEKFIFNEVEQFKQS